MLSRYMPYIKVGKKIKEEIRKLNSYMYPPIPNPSKRREKQNTQT
jgi:hypothetical protein